MISAQHATIDGRAHSDPCGCPYADARTPNHHSCCLACPFTDCLLDFPIARTKRALLSQRRSLTIKRLYSQGLSVSQLSQLTNISRRSIYRHLAVDLAPA